MKEERGLTRFSERASEERKTIVEHTRRDGADYERRNSERVAFLPYLQIQEQRFSLSVLVTPDYDAANIF